MHKRLLAASLILLFFSLSAHAYGPFDYTNPDHYREKLPIVEGYHFNSDVENLRAGMTSAYVVTDITYVLKVFPNHHRALNSMARLWRQYRKENLIPPGSDPRKTPEYYFKRAINFAPKDGTARMLYAIHLHRSGKLQEALVRYKEAELLIPNSPELHYNLGLLYLSMNKTNRAREYAVKAYNKHYPLQGLKRKLKKIGAWNDGAPK